VDSGARRRRRPDDAQTSASPDRDGERYDFWHWQLRNGVPGSLYADVAELADNGSLLLGQLPTLTRLELRRHHLISRFQLNF
jgi:hypothetical protein